MEHLRYPNESTEYRAARSALLNDENHLSLVSTAGTRIKSAHKWPEPMVIDTDDCPTPAGLGKSSDHQPATR